VNALRRLIARLRYGSSLAVDPAWREAHVREAEARRRHQSVRQYQQAKRDAVHRALAGGR
jgi:hypothetical protein